MPHLPLVLALALVTGLAGGVFIDAPLALPASLTLSASWAFALLGYQRAWPRVQLASLAVAVGVAGCVLGGDAIDRALHSPLRTMLEQRLGGFAIEGVGDGRAEEPIVIEGRLREDAALTATGASLRMDVARVWIGLLPEPAPGGVALSVGGAMHAEHLSKWTAGRVVRAPALLRRPATYLNEGLPDQERALARRGITLVGSIKSAALVDVQARGRWWEELAAQVRLRTRVALELHVRPRGEQSAAIATAILIGDRAGLDIDVERRLQEAGTYHVIAISGGNIAILAGLMLGALGWLGLRGRVAALSTIAGLTAYAVVAAGGASVARATLMAGVYLAVRLIDQRTAAANAIGITGSVLLLINPLAIADVGFWLTFGATTAIIVGASLVTLPTRSSTRAVVAVFVASACAELALAPVGAMVFQRVTLAGLLLNFAALPAMTVVQIAAMLVVCCDVAGLQIPAAWAGQLVHAGSVALTESARVLDYAPWLTWRVPSPSVLVIAAYYTALTVAVASFHVVTPEGRTSEGGTSAVAKASAFAEAPADRRSLGGGWLADRRSLGEGRSVPPSRARAAMEGGTSVPPLGCRLARASRRLSVAAVATLFVWIVAAPPARVRASGDGLLHLTVFDVGQGDAMLVTFPTGLNLVVDTGGVTLRGEFDIGDRVLGPALRARRLLQLEYLAVTHGDPDHIGGARSLIRDFNPREVWWGVPVANHEPTAVVRAEADRVRAAWRTLQRGDRLEVGGVELRVHHPPPPDWERQRVRNDDSLVLELRFRTVSILLTGDISREIERELLSTLDLLPTVVLKVPHHGSGTSSGLEFVEKLRPKVAVIGVGRGNPYRHPVPYVLERYQRAETEVFRTDLDGQVELMTDGTSLTVRTWTGRRVVK